MWSLGWAVIQSDFRKDENIGPQRSKTHGDIGKKPPSASQSEAWEETNLTDTLASRTVGKYIPVV